METIATVPSSSATDTTPTTANHRPRSNGATVTSSTSSLVMSIIPRHGTSGSSSSSHHHRRRTSSSNNNNNKQQSHTANGSSFAATVSPDKGGIGSVVVVGREPRPPPYRQSNHISSRTSATTTSAATPAPAAQPVTPDRDATTTTTTTTATSNTGSPVSYSSGCNNNNINSKHHLHYRQNFGKDGIYVSPPPVASSAPSRLSLTGGAQAPAGAATLMMMMTTTADDDDNDNNDETMKKDGPNDDVVLLSRARGIVLQRQQARLAAAATAAATDADADKRQDSPVEYDDDDDDDVPFDQRASDDNDGEKALALRRGGRDGINSGGLAARTTTAKDHLYADDDDDDDDDNEMEQDQDANRHNGNNDDDDSDSGIRDLLSISSKRALSIISPRPDGEEDGHGANSNALRTTTTTTTMKTTTTANEHDSVCTPQSTKFESIWLSSPETSPRRRVVDGGADSTAPASVEGQVHQQIGLFTVPPPKVSDPTDLDERLLNLERQQEIARRTIDARKQKIYDQYHGKGGVVGVAAALMTPPRGTTSMEQARQVEYEDDDGVDTLFDFVEKEEQVELMHQTNDAANSVNGGDDLLNKNIRITHRVRRKVKGRRKLVSPPSVDPTTSSSTTELHMTTEDDTSTENYGAHPVSPTNLQQRAHQAWKSRQKKNNSNMKSKTLKDDAVFDERAGATASSAGGSSNHFAKLQRTTNVSFGKSDTIHHFETDTTGEGGDGTVCDRSLNSEYTKTMESEVEDMIKDILLIGDGKAAQPGRRQYKDKPSVKRKLRNRHQESSSSASSRGGGLLNDFPLSADDDSTEDDEDQTSYLPAAISSQVSSSRTTNTHTSTSKKKRSSTHGSQRNERGRARTRGVVVVDDERLDETADESTVSADTTMTSESQSFSQRRRRKGGGRDDRSIESSTACSMTVDTFLSDEDTKRKGRRGEREDDPFAAVLGMMEGGLSAVTSAIEYAIESAGQEDKDTSSNTRRSISGSQKKNDSMNPFDSCTGKQQPLLESGNVAAMAGVTDLAQDLWFGQYIEPGPEVTRQRSGSKRSFDEHDAGSHAGRSYNDEDKMNDEKREHTRRMLSLGNGEQVATLAIHAAHSTHRIQGIEYDESVTIDMYKDLKICEVYLTLPLGIVFMENDGGCFVTKVSPDGSAARSGGVEVGDQLASINGQTALNMKVDDICNVVASSPDSKHVDLVFLRYIGPFRPANNPRKSGFGERSRSFKRAILGRKKEPADSAAPSETPVGSPKRTGNGFRLFGRGKNKGAKEESKKNPNKKGTK